MLISRVRPLIIQEEKRGRISAESGIHRRDFVDDEIWSPGCSLLNSKCSDRLSLTESRRSRSSMMATMRITLVYRPKEHVDELHLIVLCSAIAIETFVFSSRLQWKSDFMCLAAYSTLTDLGQYSVGSGTGQPAPGIVACFRNFLEHLQACIFKSNTFKPLLTHASLILKFHKSESSMIVEQNQSTWSCKAANYSFRYIPT